VKSKTLTARRVYNSTIRGHSFSAQDVIIPGDKVAQFAFQERMEISMEEALSGITVLEPAQYLSGPVAGMLLADMGATVIHIERPKIGDSLRAYGFKVADQSSRFLWANRNKKGITLDLSTEQGTQIFRNLAKRADVIIENFPPGTMRKFGISYEELKEVNPEIIFASISGFGQYGPYKDRVAFDLVAQAAGGLMSVTGYPEQPPVRAGAAIADILGGLMALSAILTALFWRERTRRGQHIDISLMDAVFFTLGYQFIDHINFGLEGGRQGNRYPGAGVTDIYESTDGYFVLQVPTDQLWRKLAAAIAREDLINDSRFDTNLKRWENDHLVHDVIEQWSRNKSLNEITEALVKAEIPFFPVMTLDQLATDPSLVARDMILEREQPFMGKIRIPGIPMKLSATPGRIDKPAPSLGEHNEEVYGQLLGLTTEVRKKLEDEGVI